jgi:hypothetical protein
MTTATTTTTAAPGKRPAVPFRLCGGCGSSAGDPDRRFLCARCYADGPTRSRFRSDGTRIAEPPVVAPRDNDGTPPGRGEFAKGRRSISGRETFAVQAGDEEVRRLREDGALLSAVQQLTEAGNHIAADGLPAAGQRAACRLADLGEHRSEVVVERLLKSGRLKRVEVRTRNAEGHAPGGKPAKE